MELKPGYKQTDVGVIPAHWHAMFIKDGVVLLSGQHVLAHNCNSDGKGLPYLTGPADFPNGKIVHTKFTEMPTTVCGSEDILITVKGSGAGSLILADGEYCISRQLMAVRALGWDKRFFYYSLLHRSLQIQGAATGLIPGLSRSDILGGRLACPPLPEQRAIAAALSNVDALISALEKLIAKKRDLKQAAIQRLLTGKQRLPGFRGQWEVKRLGDIGTFSKGKGIRKDQVVAGGIPCIRYGDIYTHHNDYIREFYSFIPPEIAKESQRLRKGDLLFAGSGETAEEIGKCVAFIGSEEAYAGGDIVIFAPSNQHSIYLGYLMNDASICDQKARIGQGDAVVHISARNLAQLQLRLPDFEEQRAIAAVFSDMDAEIAALERKRDKTRLLKQGMMQELLTGRIRLPMPADEEVAATP
jgi:type I restriction enzyme S subunit